MRFKKTIVFSIIILITFLTYMYFKDNKINYVVLGDSVAAGVNPYGEIGYSYADYFKEYLEDNKKLGRYIKGYATSGYTTSDIITDINTNKKIIENNTEINIREALRESDIVTISIGANDFLKGMSIDNINLNDITDYKNKINVITKDIDELLNLIRKYAKNKIILIGYYNPFPILFTSYEKNIDELFNYQDQKFQEICNNYNIDYISVYNEFKENSEYLPNPFDIHPNLKGYKAISDLIIKEYKK